MVNHRGRCYNLLLSNVADVIAIMLCMADGKPTKFHVTTFVNVNGRCYSQGGTWNSHQPIVYHLPQHHMAITSAKAHHLPLQHHGITSAIVFVSLHQSVHKIAGCTNTHTPSSVGKLLRLTFSSDLRKLCLKTGKKTCLLTKFNSVFEKISKLHEFEQNERHPLTYSC